MVAQVAEPQPSAPQRQQQLGPEPEPALTGTKTLICALNFLSRNLPLPQHVYDAVSSIYQDPGAAAAPDEVDRDVAADVSKVSEFAPSFSFLFFGGKEFSVGAFYAWIEFVLGFGRYLGCLIFFVLV